MIQIRDKDKVSGRQIEIFELNAKKSGSRGNDFVSPNRFSIDRLSIGMRILGEIRLHMSHD